MTAINPVQMLVFPLPCRSLHTESSLGMYSSPWLCPNEHLEESAWRYSFEMDFQVLYLISYLKLCLLFQILSKASRINWNGEFTSFWEINFIIFPYNKLKSPSQVLPFSAFFPTPWAARQRSMVASMWQEFLSSIIHQLLHSFFIFYRPNYSTTP